MEKVHARFLKSYQFMARLREVADQEEGKGVSWKEILERMLRAFEEFGVWFEQHLSGLKNRIDETKKTVVIRLPSAMT